MCCVDCGGNVAAGAWPEKGVKKALSRCGRTAGFSVKTVDVEVSGEPSTAR
ncbi:MAG: hypothetical protein ACKERG_00055 [Candidatus Hodgkinia cicadicola]